MKVLNFKYEKVQHYDKYNFAIIEVDEPFYEVKLSQDEYDKVRKALKHGK
jgi:hypothetical protein